MSGRRNGTTTLDDAITYVLRYRRVSSKKQERKISLKAQDAICADYNAKQAAWLPAQDFFDVQTGRDPTRAGYQELLLALRGHITAGHRVVVLVAAIDRLGRDLEESQRAWKEIEKLGVGVYSVREGGVVQWQMFTLLAFLAEDETRRISLRVKEAWSELDRLGWHRPGRPAWGYTYRPATPDEEREGAPKSVLVPHETEAVYAQQCWTRHVRGEGVQTLTRWTASLPVAARGTRTLRGSALRELLRLPVYIGRLGGVHDVAACLEQDARCAVLDAPRGRWKPLVDDATWEQMHEQYRRARRLPAQASGRYLLTGLLRCPACSGRMVGNPGNRARAARDNYRGAVRDLQRYICSERLHGDDTARATPCYATVQARGAEAPVLATVAELLDWASDPDARREIAAAARRRVQLQLEPDEAGREIATMRADLKEARAFLVDAGKRLFRGEISAFAYGVMEGETAPEIERLEGEILRLTNAGRYRERPNGDGLLRVVDGWQAAIAAVRADPSADPYRWRPILELVIEWVRPVRVGRGQYEAAVGLTAVGHQLLEYACDAGRAGPNLVAVRQLGTTNCRTATQRAAAAALA